MLGITQILAVDGGGTKTEAARHDPTGTVLGAARTGPCNLHQDVEAGLRAVEAAWRACGTAAGLDPDRAAAVTCLSAGLAGVSASAAAERFHAGFARRRVPSDGCTPLIGAFDGAARALLSIGTSVGAYRLDATGRFRMLSGWGHPAGDRGGGAWRGLRLIGDWLEVLGGYRPAPVGHPLREQAAARIVRERAAILAWLKAARPGDAATPARPVVAAAAAGDRYARSLLDEALGHDLRLARALAPG